MQDKVLFIDGQVFQSEAWHRGMGKYSLNFIEALSRAAGTYKSINIVLNTHLPLSGEVESTLQKVMPEAAFVYVNLKTPSGPRATNLAKLQAYNKSTLTSFMATYNAEPGSTDYLILSLFIFEVCSVFPEQVRKILLFYDLIPLQYSDRYGRSPAFFDNYLTHYKTIFEADGILTISQTVADDVIVNLGINESKLCNIDGASIKREHYRAQKPPFTVPKRFILMPSGEEQRKNNARAIEGFEIFRQTHMNDAYLLVTSFFQDSTKEQLSRLSPNVIFTGNVSEAELQWLYEHCDTLLFVPEYEGLGLPILEAIETNKPVVCSDLTTFNEMSVDAFYYANHLLPSSIATGLQKAIEHEAWGQKLEQYPSVQKRYQWPHTAGKALKFLKRLRTPTLANSPKPRLAVLAPDPSAYSAIGKVVMLLHPELSKHFDIDYYLEGRREKAWGDFTRPSYLPKIAKSYTAAEFNRQRYKNYDAVLYHIGNSEFHLDTTKSALYLPGFAILHDTHVKGLFGELQRYGYMNQERVDAERLLDQSLRTTRTEYLTSIVNAQRGIVVHSEYAQVAVKHILQEPVPIAKLNLPTGTPKLTKQKVDVGFSIGFAGLIHEIKGLKVLEEAIQCPELSGARIYVFGIPVVKEDILQRLRSYPNVIVETNPTDFRFQTLLSQMDVVVSYRPQYNGETSLTIIESLRFGVVPLVRKVGWFDELSDSCAIKVTSEDQMIKSLIAIQADEFQRRKMAKQGRKIVAEEFNYQRYAQGLADLIASTQNSTTNELVAQELKNATTIMNIENVISSS